jgi:tartrate-resistant acid phosphatase type 5
MGVRFVLTTGDNIYTGGGADSDWFFTHYQPYRYILNRVPFYPSCGNHDTDESEGSDDYKQLLDNFYIRQRFFSGTQDEGDAIKDNGLFYSFHFGKDIEFISIDSARQTKDDPRAFQKAANKSFIKKAIPDVQGIATNWRIPFFHHPPYVDGPTYKNFEDVIEELVQPIFEKGAVRLVFNGHEHNCQISENNGIYYVVTGSAGDLRGGNLFGNTDAHNVAWAPAHHFTLVQYREGRMEITPYGELEDGKLRPLNNMKDSSGKPYVLPLKISLNG